MPPPPARVDVTDPNVGAEARLAERSTQHIKATEEVVDLRERYRRLSEQMRQGLTANLPKDEPDRLWSEMANRMEQAAISLASYETDKVVFDRMRNQRDAAFDSVKDSDEQWCQIVWSPVAGAAAYAVEMREAGAASL